MKNETKLLHSYAYSLYQSGKYYKAELIFRYLTMLEQGSGRFWHGLGSSLLMQRKFEEAKTCFQMMTSLYPQDVRGFLLLSETEFHLNNVESALHLLKQVEEIANEDELCVVKKEIERIKASFEKELHYAN